MDGRGPGRGSGPDDPGAAPARANPSRLFIRRPVATSLMMAAVMVVGMVAYRLLPEAALPEVAYPTIEVTTLYPGASPRVMTSAVTSPLEREFGQMPGLAQMWSVSSGGASLITLRFDLDMPLDDAEQEVQAAISAASGLLPADLPQPPVYAKVNPADAPVITLGLRSATLPLTTLYDLADTRLSQSLSQVSGVGLVTLSGGHKPAVRVRVDTRRLAALGLDLANVRSAIAAGNVNTPKGSIDGPYRAFTIDANDQLGSPEQYRRLIIAYGAGGPVRLGEVATIDTGPENAWQAASIDGQPGIVINVRRQPGANVISVVDRVQALLPQLRSSLPAAAGLEVLADRTVTIRAAIADVQFELLLAVVLVVAVIFVFLRSARATFIPATAVPLALVGTFGAMYLADFSLNTLTLMALTIATGFVVDDAIVMIENISRHIEAGEAPLAAAFEGARQIGFTIISLTFSLIAVLIPVLFMGDVVGRLFREFAITLAAAIVISAAVSLSFTPMLCARLLRPVSAMRQGGLARASAAGFEALVGAYTRALFWVVDHVRLVVTIAAISALVTIYLYTVVPKGFLPVQDTGLIEGVTVAPQSASFADMQRRQAQLVAALRGDPAVERVVSVVGIDGANTTMNRARLLVVLKPLRARGQRVAAVIARLDARARAVPGLRLFLRPVQDLSIDDLVSRYRYQFTVSATSTAALGSAVRTILERLGGLPALSGVTSDLQEHGLQAFVDVDRAAASRLGITMSDVDNALYSAFGQRQVSTIFTQSAQYRVVLDAGAQGRSALAVLRNVFITPSGGGPAVPLGAIASVSQRVTPLAIDRLGQFPAALLSFRTGAGSSLGTAVAAIDAAIAHAKLPPGVQVAFQGAAAAFEAALTNQLWLLLAAVATMYIVLGVLYESYIHPITILSTLPSAGIGALLALLMSGHELTMIAVIGIVLLIGIVQKNAILMVDFALDAQRLDGLDARAAIIQAARLRLRPILMTTFAAIFAAVPLAAGGGVGAELRVPLGLTLIGGLVFSQALTLFTTPAVYLAFERLAEATKALRARPRVRSGAGDPDALP